MTVASEPWLPPGLTYSGPKSRDSRKLAAHWPWEPNLEHHDLRRAWSSGRRSGPSLPPVSGPVAAAAGQTTHNRWRQWLPDSLPNSGVCRKSSF